jgi:carbamoyl-phosphate synthase/aspartate carbamoyltransferase
MSTSKHLLSVLNLTKVKILDYILKAENMKSMCETKSPSLKKKLEGKVLVSVFYEPSTRTSCSFQSAMLKLGGNVISITDKYSSVEKGESLEDTIKTLNSYGDAIIIRHPLKGSSIQAANASNIPVINAGDGNGEHPTQALLDIFTIKTELKKFNINLDDNKREKIYITFAGDLKNSRTIHSLICILCLFPKISFIYVSPNGLEMPEEIKTWIKAFEIEQLEKKSLQEVLQISDVVYMTRIQKERFSNEEDYKNIMKTNNYIIDENIMKYAKEKMILMHPLPRLNEINVNVDKDPRAVYFEQVKNGVYMRMAILDDILN